MKRFKLVFILFLFHTVLNGQNEDPVLKIKAELIDEDGKHLNDVQVSINGHPFTVASRKWNFELYKDSIYQIEFSKRGFIGKVITINTYNSAAEKHVFPFDLMLNPGQNNIWATYYKPISSIHYSNYKHEFIYDKSQALKRQ